MAYLIRLLTNSDDSFLWEMLYQAAHLAEEGETDVQAVMNHPELAKYVKNWGRDDDMGFVVIAPNLDRAIGAAWLRKFTGNEKGYGYVDDATPELAIAVLPAYRNQGIGTLLLSHLLEAAKTAYPAVSLSVRSTNPAKGLYERLGFKIVEGSEKINRTGGTSVTMKIDFV